MKNELESNRDHSYYIKELKLDFGSMKYNRQDLEQQLINKVNRIEMRKIGDNSNPEQEKQIDRYLENKIEKKYNIKTPKDQFFNDS